VVELEEHSHVLDVCASFWCRRRVLKIYSGRLWLVPHRDSKLRVEIELRDEKIRIVSNDEVIGDWHLAEVDLYSTTSTEAYLGVEGEELVIFTRDADFIPAMNVHKRMADSRATDTAVVPAQHPNGSGDSSEVVSFDRDKPERSASATSSERAS
jgi:hypothetical protein